jgi:YmgG-like glycine-zipper protein
MSRTRERCRRYASTRRVDVSKRGMIGIIVGMCMVAMLAVGCGTLTGAAVGAGSGAAIGAAAGDAKKGALVGAGVGAAGGAIYDATR